MHNFLSFSDYFYRLENDFVFILQGDPLQAGPPERADVPLQRVRRQVQHEEREVEPQLQPQGR